jgi:hypothetical protein
MPQTDPELAEHKKTPVYTADVPTGVISPEYGQAVSPFWGGKLHCRPIIYSKTGHDTTEIRSSARFFFGGAAGLLLLGAERNN